MTGTIMGEIIIGNKIVRTLLPLLINPYAAMVPIGVATKMVNTATFTDVQVAPIQSLKPIPTFPEEK
jgi:hypothetical protein